MKKTNLIAFAGGSYGTYLEWVLTTLVESLPVIDPGGKAGNSHGFKGNHLQNMDGWHRYQTSTQNYKFARIHPKTKKNESLIDNLKCLSDQTAKVIVLYPDHSTYLLVIHNMLYKIYDDLWNGALEYINTQDIFENWDVDPITPLENLPRWIKREFLSYNLFSAWESQVEWYLPLKFRKKNNCQYLFVKDLLFDFETSLVTLQKYLDVEYLRPIKDLTKHHKINIARQKYINQQPLAESILQSVFDEQPISWNRQDLTLFTEAWIQHRFRNQGLALKCHGLDIFPDSSVNLSKLLY